MHTSGSPQLCFLRTDIHVIDPSVRYLSTRAEEETEEMNKFVLCFKSRRKFSEHGVSMDRKMQSQQMSWGL